MESDVFHASKLYAIFRFLLYTCTNINTCMHLNRYIWDAFISISSLRNPLFCPKYFFDQHVCWQLNLMLQAEPHLKWVLNFNWTIIPLACLYGGMTLDVSVFAPTTPSTCLILISLYFCMPTNTIHACISFSNVNEYASLCLHKYVNVWICMGCQCIYLENCIFSFTFWPLLKTDAGNNLHYFW